MVTVPKSGKIAKASPSHLDTDDALLPLTDRDRDFLGRMDKMRREMDRIFNDSFDEFRFMPKHVGDFDFFNFGSSVLLKDDGSNYVVTAYLPERDMQNVTTTVEGQTLKIAAKAESDGGTPGNSTAPAISRKAQYIQVLSLPGPVQVYKMKVQRKEGILTVTLPKA